MSTPQPGSLVFCHSKGIIGSAIRWGERLRFRGTGDFYNHVAVIDHDGTVIQAEARGVTAGATLASIAPGGSYEIVTVPGVNPDQVIEFALQEVGSEYGYLTIAAIVLRIILPKWVPLPSFRSDGTWICSALSGESIRFGGWLHRWRSIYDPVPSELYSAIKNVSVRSL